MAARTSMKREWDDSIAEEGPAMARPQRVVLAVAVPGLVALLVFIGLVATTASDEKPPPTTIAAVPEEAIYPAVLSEVEMTSSTTSTSSSSTTIAAANAG